MTKVHFQKNFKNLKENTKKILKNFFKKDKEVLIKMHFGEPGNKRAFTPKDIKPVVDALKEMNPELMELNSQPHNRINYKKFVIWFLLGILLLFLISTWIAFRFG